MSKYKLPFILILLSALVSCSQNEQTNWKIADNPLITEWSDDVDPSIPWPEYPRPDMVRDTWLNMNGLWDYAITQKDQEPEAWDGKILVPYPLESALSGVKKESVKMNACGIRQISSYPRPGRTSGYSLILRPVTGKQKYG